jgi:hypothetical protein
MDPAKHRQKAERVERSLAKLQPGDYELRIEAAMLAATHWLNGSLHKLGANGVEQDVLHTYMLTVNEFRRLSAAHAGLMQAVARIEDLRPMHVRGDVPGGREAADEACALLAQVREMAVRAGC